MEWIYENICYGVCYAQQIFFSYLSLKQKIFNVFKICIQNPNLQTFERRLLAPWGNLQFINLETELINLHIYSHPATYMLHAMTNTCAQSHANIPIFKHIHIYLQDRHEGVKENIKEEKFVNVLIMQNSERNFMDLNLSRKKAFKTLT